MRQATAMAVRETGHRPAMKRSLGGLLRYRIEATDGPLGRTKDFFLDDGNWTVRHLVIEMGRWLPGRRVIVSPGSVLEVAWPDRVIRLDRKRQRLRESPEVDFARPVSIQQQMRLHQVYGWPFSWTESLFPATLRPKPVLTPPLGFDKQQKEVREPVEARRFAGPLGNSRLRSFREIRGYRVRGHDGAMGHVEDLIVEDAGWTIRYLVVDLRDWLPGGRKVLVSPARINSVDWGDREVVVALHRETVLRSQANDPQAPVNETRENQHYDSHGRPVMGEPDRRDTMENMKEYQTKMEAKLNELDRNIETLAAKAKEASTETKHSVLRAIEDLRGRTERVRRSIRSVGQAEKSAWQEVKTGLEGAWAELRNAYDRAAAQMR